MKLFKETKSRKYYISVDGKILSQNKSNNLCIELQTQINQNGYEVVNLAKAHFKVHRLVALAYAPNPDNLSDVDHIDEDKLNNHISNLRWISNKENTIHSKHKMGMGNQCKPINVNGKEYVSINEAAKYIQTNCGRSVTVDTIRRELRRYLNGQRGRWKMYGQFAIS